MKRYVSAAVSFLFAVLLSAETNPVSVSNGSRQDGMYLIPQTVYVGDRGRLVLPLGAAFAEIEPAVISEAHLLPAAGNLIITRMEIEKRSGTPRLFVDFQAYAPGLLELPPLIIGVYEFTGLTVYISSILEAEGDRVLSAAAPALPVPGTMLLIYGSIIGIILFLLIVLLCVFRGIPYMKTLRNRRHRKHAIRILRRSLHKIRNSVAKNAMSGNDALAKASRSFRMFLCFFTRANCLSMVPKEFLSLTRMMNPAGLKGGEVYIFEHTETLYEIFRHCDDLRFGGSVYGTESVLQVLNDMNRFAAAFESSEKESVRRELPLSSYPEASS